MRCMCEGIDGADSGIAIDIVLDDLWAKFYHWIGIKIGKHCLALMRWGMFVGILGCMHLWDVCGKVLMEQTVVLEYLMLLAAKKGGRLVWVNALNIGGTQKCEINKESRQKYIWYTTEQYVEHGNVKLRKKQATGWLVWVNVLPNRLSKMHYNEICLVCMAWWDLNCFLHTQRKPEGVKKTLTQRTQSIPKNLSHTKK